MAILDLLDKSKHLAEKETQARLAVCTSCPELRQPGDRCKICGCFVKLKSKLKTEHCPKRKWPGD